MLIKAEFPTYLKRSYVYFKILLRELNIRHARSFPSFLCFDNSFLPEFSFLYTYVQLILLPSGLRSAGQMHASFTSDGKHIVSLSEGSNVCIWNHTGQDKNTSKPKQIWSSESFLSNNASIAIPWCGIESMPLSPSLGEDLIRRSSLSSPDCFFMGRGFLSELVPKVSPTWPEETLLDSGQTVVSPTMCKSEYKFLRGACKGMSNSHLWNQVIVTAGTDGYIKVYQNYGLPVRV